MGNGSRQWAKALGRKLWSTKRLLLQGLNRLRGGNFHQSHHLLWIQSIVKYPYDQELRLVPGDPIMLRGNFCGPGCPPWALRSRRGRARSRGCAPARATPFSSVPPASTVVVWTVSPGAMVRPGLLAAENWRWKTVDVNSCRCGDGTVAGPAAASPGLPLEAARALVLRVLKPSDVSLRVAKPAQSGRLDLGIGNLAKRGVAGMMGLLIGIVVSRIVTADH